MRSDPAAPSDPQTSSAPAGAGRAWILPGLLIAGALLFLRTRAIEQLAISERGVDPAIARWTAAARFGSTAVHALAFGLCAAGVAARTGAGRAARPLAAIALASLLLLSVLSGWPMAPSIDLPPLAGASGLGSLALEAGLALGGGLLLFAAAHALRRPRLRAIAEAPATLALVALAACGAPLVQLARESSDPPAMRVRDVQADLALRDDRWRVIRQDEEHKPDTSVLCPLVDSRFDTADKPALVMPPPCEIELEVAADEDGGRLCASAGVGLEARRLLQQLGDHLRVRFEIEVDGHPSFDETVLVESEDVLRREHREADCAWRHAGGGAGIPLRAGQRITLRTSLPDYVGNEQPPAARGLAVGFGGLTIERDRARARTLARRDRPNLVLIVIDTLRADRMSCYGCEKPTTPELDRLAERGLVFENAFATSSWTWPSTASILTGLLPDEHGVTSNESCTLHLEVETLAEVLQQRGFTTAAFSCNPLIAPERLFDQGFESFDAVRGAAMRPSGEVIEEVLATLERLADLRFFLYLHLADPHTPHRPLESELARLGGKRPADFPDEEIEGHLHDGMDRYSVRLMKGEGFDADGTPRPELVVPPEHAQWIRDAYDACVGTSDHYCGMVLAALERLGLEDETVIAVTADHGEELFDHGMLAHGHTLYRELVHVPLILAGPDLPRGERVAWEVSNRHLAPTLARLGGAELSGVRDALDLLSPEPAQQPIFFQTEKGYWNGHTKQKLYGLREDGYVLHRARTGGPWKAEAPPQGDVRLFHIEDDPFEHADLARAPALTERSDALAAEIDSSLREQAQRRRGIALGAGAGALDMLHGVGYVGGEPDEDPANGGPGIHGKEQLALTTPRATPERSLAALALWLAAGLALGRTLLIFALDRGMRGLALDVTLWRMAQHAWLPAVHALVAAALATALCAWRARDARPARERRAADALASLLAAGLFATALAGWPIDDPSHTPSWVTPRGRIAIIGMPVLGIAAAFALLTCARALRSGRRPLPALSSRLAPLGALVLLALPPLALVFGHAQLSARSTVRDVVREIGLDASSWRENGHHPRLGPSTRVLCPVPDWRYDGGDLPGLMMPPPCAVEFDVTREDGPVFLRGAAGIDHVGYERALAHEPPVTVRFEVRVNGRIAFEHDAIVAAEQDPAEREWQRIGGARGLALVPGDHVQLTTAVTDPVYANELQVPVLPAGFGGLALERERAKVRAPASPGTPNLVLIVMDTLRQDRLSCYGYAQETTPNIDRLAARGTLFENAFATSSWTWPSTASILTGLVPESHGVEADEACYLRNEIESLPKVLSRRSYSTGAFSCNPLIVPNKGFARGFEDFDSLHGFRHASEMIHLPLEWLDMHQESRFFLYLHFVDTHAPYEPLPALEQAIAAERPADFPEGGITDYHPRLLRGEGHDAQGNPVPGSVIPPSHLRWINLLYDASVTSADHFVGLVLDRIHELGLDDNTVIAFTSDHGEEFLDHGLVTHGNTLHRELVRVPLILAGPGIPVGRRVATSVSNRHLAPTLAKLGGASFRDLPDALDLSRADEVEEQLIFFSTHQGWWKGRHRLVISGVKAGDWELHFAAQGAPWGVRPEDAPQGDLCLYHLSDDPQELRDVAADFPDKVTELKALLDRHLEEAHRARELPALGVGIQAHDLLQDIGYTEGGD